MKAVSYPWPLHKSVGYEDSIYVPEPVLSQESQIHTQHNSEATSPDFWSTSIKKKKSC